VGLEIQELVGFLLALPDVLLFAKLLGGLCIRQQEARHGLLVF